MAGSGHLLLRMSAELHRVLKRRSAEEHVSLNRFCVQVLEDAVRAPRSRGWLRSSDGLDEGLWEAIQAEWDADLVGLALFGSAARGEMTASSDVDLLVVLAPGTELSRNLYRRWDDAVRPKASRRLRARLAAHFVTLPATVTDAGGLWCEVAVDGQVLVERDGLVSRFLRMVRDAMATGAVSRRLTHGHPYWTWRRAESVGAE
jgi:hypothetical protein